MTNIQGDNMDSKINGNMLVKELVNTIANKELKVVDLAKNYSTSDRTIQNKIKKLGFIWLSKEGRYDFVGDDISVYDLTIDEVFTSKIPSRNKSNSTVKNDSKKESEKASKEVAYTLQNTSQYTPETNGNTTSNNNSNTESKRGSNETSKKDNHKDSDNIDRLLAGKKVKKAYRGFYFDDDVLSVIDSVSSGVKSELVNECLRKVFRDKGLL